MRTICMAMGALAVAGCTKYVPVEIEIAPPPAPPECAERIVRLPAMPPLPTDPADLTMVCGGKPLAVCISERWARRDLSWQGVVRRAEARRQVCATHVKGVSR